MIEMKTELNEKDKRIRNLQEAAAELRTTLETETTKVHTMIVTKTAKEKEKSKLLEEKETMIQRFREEMESKSSLIEKLKGSLESKTSKNKKLKEVLANVQNNLETSQKTADEALEESRAANADLLETLTRTKEDLKAKIRELEEEKNEHNATTDMRLESLSTRISDLSIVKETLQNENAALVRRLEEEKESYEKLANKNKELRSAMSDNEKQLRDQMNELESTMHLTLSKVESKRKKTVLEERKNFKAAIEKVEDENDGYKIKIAKMETTIRQLERQVHNTGNEGSANPGYNETATTLREENDRLRRRIETLEETSHRYSSSRARDTPDRFTASQEDNGGDYYNSIYRSERDRRLKAEEFAAAMAARAKAGFEKKNEEIVGLKMQITAMEAEKENIQNQQHLMLSSGGRRDSRNLALAVQERNEALEEAKKYRLLANKLNQQVITMGHQLESFEGNNFVIKDDIETETQERLDNFDL